MMMLFDCFIVLLIPVVRGECLGDHQEPEDVAHRCAAPTTKAADLNNIAVLHSSSSVIAP